MSTRLAGPHDDEFLFELYCAVRAPEFALLALSEEEKQYLLRQQSKWQTAAYCAAYPDSGYRIVLLDEKPVGRVWIAQTSSGFELVDIAIHPEAQRRGIAKQLLEDLQRQARACDAPIRSSVFRFNEASIRLHEKLGFRVMAADEMQLEFRWDPAELIDL